MEANGVWLACRWEFARDLFDAATIARMQTHLEMVLKSAFTNADQGVSHIPMLPADERHRLLVEWNATSKPYQISTTDTIEITYTSVRRLFEAQVGRSPEAMAF